MANAPQESKAKFITKCFEATPRRCKAEYMKQSRKDKKAKERKIGVALEVYVKKNEKYLMIHRSNKKKILPNVWMAPGGHRYYGEGLFECARREIFEETGLKIKNLKVRATGVGILEDIDYELHFHLLTADYAGGRVHGNPTDGKLVWLTPEEILNLDNLLSELRHILPHVLGSDPHTISYKAVYDKGNHMTSFELEESE